MAINGVAKIVGRGLKSRGLFSFKEFENKVIMLFQSPKTKNFF